jgi:hypothetical protein
MIYGQGIYRIIHAQGGWCVAKLCGERWHLVSNYYRYRGWAQAYARRMKLRVQNYESLYG